MASARATMATTATRQAHEKSANPAVLSTGLATAASTALSTPERRMAVGSAPEAASAPTEKKAVGYGLPCSRCHAYYPADMHVCPICKSPDRVSPIESAKHSTAPAAPQPASQVTTGAPVNIPIDDDRERFLKELKSQAFALHTQVNAAATFRCVLQHQHHGASEPAAVCHPCYAEARQHDDRLEAALHMDAKEAAKIVYDCLLY